MTRDQIALATRAVACRAWRWMPGMLTTDGFRICRVDADGYKFGYLTEYSYAHAVDGDVLPDLTDPATLGCLLALVREAWGDLTLNVLYLPTEGRWGVERWYDGLRRNGACTSEAGALVAALEAAP